MRKVILISSVLILSFLGSQAQKDAKVIQFSGYALTSDSMMGIAYTHITILNRGRLSTSGLDGFFSFAAALGDTLYFTCVGFKSVMYIIPKSMDGDKFSVIQLMTRDEVYLPATIIYPWGDRSNFSAAFINCHPPEDDLDRAKRNLERERLAAIGQKLERDGGEATQTALRNSSATKYYYGQVAPQNIFNPLAWAEFIQAWKRGDFKRDNESVKKNKDTKDNGNTKGDDVYTPAPASTPVDH